MSLNATSYPIDIEPTPAALAKMRAARHQRARIAEIRRRLDQARRLVSYTDVSPDGDFTMDMLFQFDYAADSESLVSKSKGGTKKKKTWGRNKKNMDKKKKEKAGELTRVEDEERDGFVVVNSSDYLGTENPGHNSAGKDTVARACVPVSPTSQ